MVTDYIKYWYLHIFSGFFFPDSVYNNVLEEITKFKTGIISGYYNNLITFKDCWTGFFC